MAKKREQSRLQSWNEVGEAIAQIRGAQLRICRAEVQLNNEITTLKGSYTARTDADRALITDMEHQIALFTSANKSDFADKKSREFTFGRVGFRKVTEVITRNVKAIMEACKQHGMDDCIKVTEKLDKEMLSRYDDAALTAVGAKRRESDKYYLEIDLEELE